MTTAMNTLNKDLTDLSLMVDDAGNIIQKLDTIATIYINNRFYFNVYRRYNSPYEIVIEDYSRDIYVQQDDTIRNSLQDLLCLTDYGASLMYTLDATSLKHNCPILCDIADHHWSEIQEEYQGIIVNFGGIFNSILSSTAMPSVTLQNQIISPPEVSIPKPEGGEFKMSESDDPMLSMRFSDAVNREGTRSEQVCYCQMCKDDSDDDSDVESNYTILRSGAKIPKV